MRADETGGAIHPAPGVTAVPTVPLFPEMSGRRTDGHVESACRHYTEAAQGTLPRDNLDGIDRLSRLNSVRVTAYNRATGADFRTIRSRRTLDANDGGVEELCWPMC